MSKKPPRSSHHITHTEKFPSNTPISEMTAGQVFVREAAPHMRLSPTVGQYGPPIREGYVWIVNLLTGSAWMISETTEVYPAFEVRLDFQSARVARL